MEAVKLGIESPSERVSHNVARRQEGLVSSAFSKTQI
jgi:hypothetical protein